MMTVNKSLTDTITDATTSAINKSEGVETISKVEPLYIQTNVPDIYDLLDRLNSDELTNLRCHFYEKKVDEKIKEPKGSAHPRFRGFKLTKDEFLVAIESVLNTSDYEFAASMLFYKVVEHNAEEHKCFLWWEQILDQLIEYLSDKTKHRPGYIVKESFCRLCTMSHCKRETIVRIVPVETPTSFCYVVLSKYGKIGIYDWNMTLLEQYEVRLSNQIATTTGGEVRRTTWVTDALYMSDAATLLVAASDRSLHFYSTTGLVCVPVYHISGLPNTPTCLHYASGTATSANAFGCQSMLLLGDDHGSITTMYFQQPQYALFKRSSNDALDRYYWKELSSQKAWVTITMDQEIHKDEITRVEYFRDNNTVVSCSNDPNTTVIIRYVVGRRAPYVFKISRGVRCFHLDRSLRLLVTGGKDSVVRVWNSIIPRKPIASLFGHKTCVVDVCTLKHLSVILSMCKDTVVKVWDIVGQTCMQSLPLLFPIFGALARTPEFGVRSFYPGPVSCKPTFLMPENSETKIVFSARTLTTISSSLCDESKASATCSSLLPSESRSTGMISDTTNPVSDVRDIAGYSERKLSNIGTPYTNTERSVKSVSCTGSPWTRMELLVVCCNYVVILQLSERELEDGDDARVGGPLNPPQRNKDPAVPSPWLTVDSTLLTGLTDVDRRLSPVGLSAPSIPPAVRETLQKSLGEQMTQEFTALAATCYSREAQQTDLRQIQVMVDHCAPHLALGSVKIEDIPFAPIEKRRPRKGRRKEDGTRVKDTGSKSTKDTVLADESHETSSTSVTHSTTSSKKKREIISIEATEAFKR